MTTTKSSQSTQPIWKPSANAIKQSNLTKFMDTLDIGRVPYDQLHRWSVEHSEQFWEHLWHFADIRGDLNGPELVKGGNIRQDRWFPNSKISYAENMLKHADNQLSMVFWSEDKYRTELTYGELKNRVCRLRAFFRQRGIEKGDRIAALMPNRPETIIAALAASSLGAVFTSASPDFGVQGVLDRFGQVSPKVIMVCDGYWYNGKAIDVRGKNEAIIRQLDSVVASVHVGFEGTLPEIEQNVFKTSVSFDHIMSEIEPDHSPFLRVSFDHPLFIMYSSGTTGKPKSIIHSTGGTLLQHAKEQLLHANVQPGNRLFYFTTCGWMMWNWLISGLAQAATIVLYDGNPLINEGNILWDMADQEGIEHFGTSAKYLQMLEKQQIRPMDTHNLSSIRSIMSTGGPLTPNQFEFVYQNIKSDVQLSSMSGGTDILGCFVLGNPNLPVWSGEIQCAGLGLSVTAFKEDGQAAATEEKGELVCTQSFPNMPIGFWNDDNGERYRKAYFDRFEDIWCHGDWCATTKHGGWVIHGRSDTTLNPGGVRIGTAEIYRQLDQIHEVSESVVIGQQWDGDVRVVLFVKLASGVTLDETLQKCIKQRIRENASPRHVPAKILSVSDIPKTHNGKLVEVAVRDAVHGRQINNTHSIANASCLAEFRNRAELSC